MAQVMESLVLAGRDVPVREWVRRRIGGIGHEERVGRIARMLFDVTRPWHGLAESEWRILALGALVHDVGRAVCDDGHEKVGAKMLLNDRSLTLGESERRRLAFLTRYHRGSVPALGEEKHLDFSRDDVGTMRAILGFLRAADALDSRHVQASQLVATKYGRTITVYGYVSQRAAVEKLGSRKKFRLLESVLDCALRTEWFLTERMVMVC